MARYIDADALIKETVKEFNHDGAYGYMDTKSIVDLINDAPTVDVVERKKGRWEVIPDDTPNITYDICKCSECGTVEYFNKGWKRFNFCPNCGAHLERE